MSKSCLSHVWSGNIIRFQFPTQNPNLTSINKYSFYSSICVHILSNQKLHNVPAAIFPYPHHFPSVLIQWQSRQTLKLNFTKPLLFADAKEIQGTNVGSQPLYDKSNTVTYYHNIARGKYGHLSRIKLSDNKFKKECVKSPLTLPHEFETYLMKLKVMNPSKYEETNNEDDVEKTMNQAVHVSN